MRQQGMMQLYGGDDGCIIGNRDGDENYISDDKDEQSGILALVN
jgi:hypothetical protein